MRDDNKKIKYSIGASTDTHLDQSNPPDSVSFEITSKDKIEDQTPGKNLKRHFGTHFPFYWRHNEPVFTIGPHWPFFLCMWSLLIGIGVLVVVYVAIEQSMLSVIVTIVLTLWTASIYLITSLKNPGIATAQDPDDPEIENMQDYPNFCRPCRILKTDDIYHCFECDVCIRGYDHHCPWTGKCIGEGNIKPFYLFIMSTAIYIISCILISLNLL